MQWGVALTTYLPPDRTQQEVFSNSRAFARAAEALGFSDAWVLEHHFIRYGLCPHALTMAASLLGETSTLRVGTAVSVAPLDHPVRVAEQVAMIDHMSEGRLLAGFGRGFFAKDFEVFGIDVSTNHLMLREFFDIARAVWSGEPVAWKSDVYEFPEVTVYPHPFTTPHPPLYVVGESPSTVEWAASQGIPLLLQIPAEDEAALAHLELYALHAELAGHDPTTIPHVMFGVAHLAATKEQAQDEIVANIGEWHETADEARLSPDQLRSLPNYRFHYAQVRDGVLAGQRSVEDFIRRGLRAAPVGTPQDCIDRFGELRDKMGIEHFVCGFEGVLDPTRVIESMQQFAEEVMPAL